MDKLNNEELNKVSAGGDSHDVPSLEWMELYLHNHYSQCRHCGTPVRDFEAYEGPIQTCSTVYQYEFHCKCPQPSRRQKLVWWHSDTGQITVTDGLV